MTIDIRPLRLSDCEKIGPMLREIWLDAYHGIQTDEELLAQSHKVHTPEQIADGRFFYKLELHPTSVMERLTTDSYVDTKFIADALALAA